jgi:hypothetical protein
MKKSSTFSVRAFALLYLILLCCVQIANAQDYKPFPTSNAMWRENSGGYEADCEHYQYLIAGDTLINERTYHKLEKSGIKYYPGYWGGCDFDHPYKINNYYVGFFRNDISSKRVYFIEAGTEIEKVIYDFSLSVGDTVPELYPDGYYTIDAIDSIDIGGIYHKRFLIDNNCWDMYDLWIIEGIGSTYGLLSPFRCPFEWESKLGCFSINEETLYKDPWWEGDCAPIYLGIEKFSQNETMISLYPNPTTGEMRIESAGWRVEDVEIFDMYGRKQNVRIQNLSSVESKLDISQLSAGIYFAKIFTEAGEVIKKVLKE